MKTQPTSATYDTFINQLRASKVQQVTIKSRWIEYQLKADGSKRYRTNKHDSDDNLISVLNRQNVAFEIERDNSEVINSLLAMLISSGLLVGVFAWLSKLSTQGGIGVGMGVGKSNARVYQKGKTGITFADVAGVDEAKQELQEVVDFLQNGDKYRKIGAKIPKGVLLVGAPGTGKTLLAKAVAGEAGVPFLSMSGSEFVELYVGVGASRVRDLFNKAKSQAPCIVFIDELDAIGKSRGNNPNGGNDEREQTLNQLLTEMDGFDGNEGVILIAATNRPEILDPALRRPGRFDRQVLVDRPDKSGRIEILKVHSRKVMLGEDVDLEEVAAQTSGFAGADLANLVNEAALLAARNDRQAVLMTDFAEAFERVVAGLEKRCSAVLGVPPMSDCIKKRSRILTPLERQTVAYHEVGHAMVGALMPGGDKVSKISIVPRGLGALGYTLQTPEADRFLLLEDELRGKIATLLGGRAAETVVFNKVSTGASDDIQKATELAEKAVTQYGMSSVGPIAFAKEEGQFLNNSTSRRTVGGEVTAEIDRLVKQNLDRAYEIAQKILELNRDLLESTTHTLLQDDVLEGSRLKMILAQVKAPDDLAEFLAG